MDRALHVHEEEEAARGDLAVNKIHNRARFFSLRALNQHSLQSVSLVCPVPPVKVHNEKARTSWTKTDT